MVGYEFAGASGSASSKLKLRSAAHHEVVN